MTEEQIRAYAALRAQKLMLTGAERFHYTEKVVGHWMTGEQADVALRLAAKELRCE